MQMRPCAYIAVVEKEEKGIRALPGVNDPHAGIPPFSGFTDDKAKCLIGYFLVGYLLSRRSRSLNIYFRQHHKCIRKLIN